MSWSVSSHPNTSKEAPLISTNSEPPAEVLGKRRAPARGPPRNLAQGPGGSQSDFQWLSVRTLWVPTTGLDADEGKPSPVGPERLEQAGSL